LGIELWKKGRCDDPDINGSTYRNRGDRTSIGGILGAALFVIRDLSFGRSCLPERCFEGRFTVIPFLEHFWTFIIVAKAAGRAFVLVDGHLDGHEVDN
jgi:hypothetical protein